MAPAALLFTSARSLRMRLQVLPVPRGRHLIGLKREKKARKKKTALSIRAASKSACGGKHGPLERLLRQPPPLPPPTPTQGSGSQPRLLNSLVKFEFRAPISQ